MNSTELQSTLDVLHAADPDCAERGELAELVAAARRLRGWIDNIDLKCARRTRHLAEQGRAEPAESMFGREGQLSSRDAGKLVDRENVGASMGSFEAALGEGDVAAGHLDAIAAATKGLDDDTRLQFRDHEEALLSNATTDGVDAFGRRCRQLARQLVAAADNGKSDADELDAQRERSRVKRWVDKITGMHHTHLELDPVRDAKLWSVVDAQLASLRQADGNARTPWSQLQVNAFVAAAETSLDRGCGPTGVDEAVDRDSGDRAGAGAGAGGGRGASVPRLPEISVLVDWQTLTSGLHGSSVCETEDGVPLPVSTVRRLCCEADVLPAVLGGNGEVLDVGRSRRTANRQQRRALRAMHRTCAHPDCTVGFSACRIHHIRWWWEHHGPTDLDNLLPLCEKHHHLVHEQRWSVTMTPDRVTTWTRPDGTVAYVSHSNDRRNEIVDSGSGAPNRQLVGS